MHSLKIPINKIILYIFPVINYWGYSFIYTDLKIWKTLQFVSIPLLFLYTINKIRSSRKTSISKCMTVFLGLVVLSIAMSYIVWGQNIILGYRASAGFLSIVFYFFLLKSSFSEVELNRFVQFYGILWIAVWGVNMIFAPIPIFGLLDADMINDSRGIVRYFIQGAGFLYLLFFFYFNRWLNEKKKVFLILSLAVFFVIVLQVTRQTILFSLLVALYYLLKKNKHVFLIIAMLIVSLNFVDVELPKNSVLGKMIELSQDQYKDNASGRRNIRLDEYEYFFTEYSPNFAAVLFGNGLPHDDSYYGLMYTKLRLQRKYFYSDVGYAGIYVMMGLTGLIFMGVFFVVVIKQKQIDRSIQWTKMYLIYVFLCNSVSFVVSTSIIPMSVALYLMNKSEENQKKA